MYHNFVYKTYKSDPKSVKIGSSQYVITKKHMANTSQTVFLFYYTSHDLLTIHPIVTSEGNSCYCLMAVLP